MIMANRNRRIRVVILELLHTAYPGGMDTKSLWFAVDNLGYAMPIEHLYAHIKYLEEKGYVKQESRKGHGFAIDWVTLTASGWDFIDGHITDEKGIDTSI